jgi:tape measure domain-containing protein
MREKAAKTPFGMEDLASASQTMLSFGISAEDSMKYMDMLGDIALGNKEKLGTLSLAFSQISSAGKLTGQDLLQLINAGFNPLQTIADKTGASVGDLKAVMSGGKTSKEFQKLVKDAQKEVARLGDNASESSKMLAQIGDEGMISADMVGQAMEIETSEGGRFYQGMLKASKTMSGIISTLKDDAMNLIGNVFAPLSASIAEGVLPLVSGYLSSLTNAFEKGGTEGLINRLGTVIADIFIKAADALPGVIDIATNILTTIVKSITRVAPRLAKSAASALASFVKGAAGFLPVLTEALGSLLSEAASALSETAPELLVGLADGLMDSLLAVDWDKLISSLAVLLDSLRAGLFDALWAIAPKLGELIVKIGAALIKAIPQLLKTLGDAIIEAINFIFGTNIPKISEIDFPSWEEIKEKVSVWWTEFKAKFAANMNDLRVALGLPTWAEFKQSISSAWEAIKQGAKDLFKLDIDLSLPQWLADALGVDAKAPGKASGVYIPVGGPGGGGQNVVQTRSTNRSASVANAAAQTRDKVREQLAAESSAFSQIGSDIVQYMAQGVTESAAEFVESLSSSIESSGARIRESGLSLAESIADGTLMGEGILANAFSELLNETKSDALSRVREFEDVGYQIPAGISRGVERGESTLIQAIERMVDDALRAARNRAQIQSPSRLFENEFGGYLPAGAARGVDKNSHLLQASVQRMVDNSLPDMANFGAGLGSWNAFERATAGSIFQQTNNFNVPVQTPDEFAATMHQYATYGLAGEA